MSTDVAQVVEATRHLHDFREGFAQHLQWVACRAVIRMPDEGRRLLEPLLRILGAEQADTYADKLYVAAANCSGGWDPTLDPDMAQHKLEALCADVAHAVADEFNRDARCCWQVGR